MESLRRGLRAALALLVPVGAAAQTRGLAELPVDAAPIAVVEPADLSATIAPVPDQGSGSYAELEAPASLSDLPLQSLAPATESRAAAALRGLRDIPEARETHSAAFGEPSPALAVAPDHEDLGPLPSASVLLERVPDDAVRNSIAHKIYTDPLTGLLRRSWAEDHLEAIVRSGAFVSIVDLDHFKTGVNDRYGHDVGDIAIQEVAKLLTRHTPPGGAAIRWGGEEFLLTGGLRKADAAKAAEALRADAEKGLAVAVQTRAQAELGKTVDLGRLTLSVGVAPLLKNQGSAHANWIASVAEADSRLYKAKEGGRNRVETAVDELWDRPKAVPSILDYAASLWRRAAGKKQTDSVLSGHLRWSATKSKGTVEELLAQVQDPVLRGQLAQRIYTDALTGCFNRAHLHDHLAENLARYRSIIAIDVDFFKRINDRHGHQKGDQVLVSLAHILKTLGGGPVYRMGGEEFLILAPEDLSLAAAKAHRVRRAVEKGLGLAAGISKVTISLGVAPIQPPRPGSGIQEAFRASLAQADAALYESKSSGRNRVTLSGSKHR